MRESVPAPSATFSPVATVLLQATPLVYDSYREIHQQYRLPSGTIQLTAMRVMAPLAALLSTTLLLLGADAGV